MTIVSAETLISAPAADVWAMLMDFPGYARWNPFIRRIEGERRLGAKLLVELGPEGERPVRFRPTVIQFEPGARLAWLGSLPIPGLFSGVHEFVLTAVGDQTRFVQSERFSGLLIAVFGGMLTKTETAFAQMNAALKAEAERLTPLEPAE